MSYLRKHSDLPEVARSALIQTDCDWHEARRIVLDYYGRDMPMSQEVFIEDYLRDLCDKLTEERKLKKAERYKRMKDGY